MTYISQKSIDKAFITFLNFKIALLEIEILLTNFAKIMKSYFKK